MLRVLEPLDLRAAAALALAYFAALRPCEIRGLTWADYDGIEPLRGLLERLRVQQGALATADAPILPERKPKTDLARFPELPHYQTVRGKGRHRLGGLLSGTARHLLAGDGHQQKRTQ